LPNISDDDTNVDNNNNYNNDNIINKVFNNNLSKFSGGAESEEPEEGETKGGKKKRKGERSAPMAGKIARGDPIPRIVESIAAITGGRRHSEAAVRRVVEKACDARKQVFNEEAAREWACGFEFDRAQIEADDAELKRYGLVEMARRRQNAGGRKDRRLNPNRVLALGNGGDPDIQRLMRMATRGASVHTAADFVENGAPPPIREKYVAVAAAVNKKLAGQLALGNGILVSNEAIRLEQQRLLEEGGRGFHYSNLHWTEQDNKPEGRVLMDASNAPEGTCPLNAKEPTQAAKEEYGEIKHPTIDDVIRMILRMAKKYGGDNIIMWKMDVRGAFTLLDFDPEVVRLLAYEVTGDATFIPIAGVFGLGGMPYAFNVPTKVIRRLTRLSIKGEMEMYCDDGIGCCHVDDCEHDRGVFGDSVERVLGEGTVEVKKTVWGRRMVALGWDFDLDTQSFSLSRGNIDKALVKFLRVDEEANVSVKEIQTLASYTARYSKVCRQMKPYGSLMYAPLKGKRWGGRSRGRKSLSLSPETQVCIKRWRAFLCLQELEPEKYRRSMLDFTEREPEFIIQYDASLEGFGILISRLREGGSRELIMVSGFMVDGRFAREKMFDLRGDSGFQNSMEFLAIVVALALMRQEGIRDSRVQVLGDNISSLSWATCERFCTGPSENAVTAFTILGRESRIFLEEDDKEHIEGVKNVECDDMSRGIEPEGRYRGDLIREIRTGSPIWELVRACDPRKVYSTEVEIGEHYRELEDIISRI